MQLTSFETAIKAFLDEYVQDNPTFAKTYSKPHKNISECCKYICEEVSKSRKGKERCVACSDEEVYGLALHYYDEDSIVVKGTETIQAVKAPAKAESFSEKNTKKPGQEVKAVKSRTRKKKDTTDDDPNIPDPLIFPVF